jgi:hypothetical protein
MLLRAEPVSSLLCAYYHRRMNTDQWFQINRQALETHRLSSRILNKTESRIVQGLRKHGLDSTTAEQLFGSNEMLTALQAEADKLFRRPRLREQIQTRQSSDGAKWYVIRALGLHPRAPVPNSIADVALDEKVLSIVNT